AAITFSEGLKEKLLALREKAIQLRSKSVSTVETSPVEEGSAVWLLPTKKNSKISPRLRGPFIVVSNLANNMISIRSLIEEATVMNVHIRRVIVVKGEHTHEELRNMAAASEGEYFIEALVDHRGDSKKDLEFLVQWAGYQPEENTWEPLSELKDTIALDKYIKDHMELRKVVGK
ncbi:hypothetical protein ADUPG1_003764, partial [Aduncisulcus paluster]